VLEIYLSLIVASNDLEIVNLVGELAEEVQKLLTWNADEEKGIKNADIEARLIRYFAVVLNKDPLFIAEDWLI
jgi:hypothetical protein